MHRVELPGGNWAELSDPDELTEGQRRPLKIAFARVLRSAQAAGYVESGDRVVDEARVMELADPEIMFAAGDALVAAFVRAWSYQGEPSAQTAQALPGRHYDLLEAELGELGSQVKSDDVSDPGDTEKRDSPFGSSNGSSTSPAVEKSAATLVPAFATGESFS